MLKELFQKLKKDQAMEEPVVENISLTEVSEIPVTKGLDILVLADTHGVIINDILRNKIKTEPDLILILGDLYIMKLVKLTLCFQISSKMLLTDFDKMFDKYLRKEEN